MRLSNKGLCLVGVVLLLFVLFGIWVCKQDSKTAFFPGFSDEEILIIDAGHGGADGGAVSISGILESDINLSIAKRLQQLCGLVGVPHTMTRWDENSIHDEDAYTLREQKRSDLYNRVALVNEIENGCLVSIHQNIYESGSSKGAQVFYRDDDSQLWAVETQELLRQVDGENTRLAARIPESVYLMSHVSCPAILVECGFLSNARDEEWLTTSEYQTKLAAVLLSSFLTRQ